MFAKDNSTLVTACVFSSSSVVFFVEHAEEALGSVMTAWDDGYLPALCTL